MTPLPTSDDPFDPVNLQLPTEGNPTASPTPRKRPPRAEPGQAFLKGPIPWDWLAIACRLSGHALGVALLLWKDVGCRRSRTVTFHLAEAMKLCGISDDTARRGIQALKDAGLISTVYLPGRNLEITLLDAPTLRILPDSDSTPKRKRAGNRPHSARHKGI